MVRFAPFRKKKADPQLADQDKTLYAVFAEIAGKGLADMGVTTTETRWLLPIAIAIHSLQTPKRKGRQSRK